MRMQILILLLIAVCGTVSAQSNTGNKNTLLLGKQKSFTISKATLIGDPVLHLSEAYGNYRVTSYQISHVPKGEESKLLGPFLIKSNAMTTGYAADILRKAQPGDKIFLEEVVAVSNDANKLPLKLASVAIQVQ